MKENYEVRQIPYEQVVPWLLYKHYAKRVPSISFAFGLYRNKEIIGVVSYGTPPSSSLQEGICGKRHADKVIELNRLVIEEGAEKNCASLLVGKSLQMLPKPKIVVSYADTEMEHLGIVYQATNFVYTGLSAKRTDWKLKGKEHLHGYSVADMSRGQENRAEYMREKFGEDFYLQERSRKHRYIYFLGCDEAKRDLKYLIYPYPKGQSKRYDSGQTLTKQTLLF